MTRPRPIFPWRAALVAGFVCLSLIAGQVTPSDPGGAGSDASGLTMLPPAAGQDTAGPDAANPGAPATGDDATADEAIGPVARLADQSADPTDPAGGNSPVDANSTGNDLAATDPAVPSIEYEQAIEHESDADTFVAGDAVDVAFVPEAGDPDVDGGQPLALPAGIASGAAIAAERTGSVWASARTAAIAETGIARTAAQAGASARASAAGATTAGAAKAPSAGTTPPGATASTSRTAAADDMAPAAFGPRRRQVIGFLPYWKLRSAAMHYDVLTTIAYFGVGVTSTGHLRKRDRDGTRTIGWAGWTSAHMSSIIRNAHRRHVRVVLTVQMFAWTDRQARAQASFLGSPSRRARLAKEIAAAVRERGADGVNLDFEPIVRGHSLDFVRFVRTLRAALDRHHRGYELTVDTTGFVGNYDIPRLTARGAADAVVVMGYDYRTAGSAPGSVSPLARDGYDLRDTIRRFRARTSASKIILGLPWYGRAWSTRSPKLGAARASAAKYGSSVAAEYGLAVRLATLHGYHYIKSEAVAWTTYKRRVCTPRYGCVVTWRKLFFDDARSLAAKIRLLKTAHLRGTAIWALGFEDSRPELWRVYRRAFPKR